MDFEQTKTHYEIAGQGANPYTIVRHLWTDKDFKNRTDETVLDLFDFPFSSEKTFCDYGCGLGYTCKIAAPLSKKYFGIDISQSLLKHAAKNNAYNGKVEWLVSDGKAIPLPDNSVDILISEQVVQHILEDNFKGKEIFEGLVKEFYRISTDNAAFCIQVPKVGAYVHGVSKKYLSKLFKDCSIVEIDNWYFHVIKNVQRNNTEMWLNVGKFRERDIELFGSKYVDFRLSKIEEELTKE